MQIGSPYIGFAQTSLQEKPHIPDVPAVCTAINTRGKEQAICLFKSTMDFSL